MTIQGYLIIESNVVTNLVEWDGNPATWSPPADSIQLVNLITPALVWQENTEKTDWILVEVIGAGGIGFTWNGNILTTNQPKPI